MLLLTSFLLGLASSIHCIGMCGPIAMALPLDRSSKGKQIAGLLSYNLGRIYVYALLGLLFGSLGFSLTVYRLFQALSLALGIVLVLLAWKKTWIKYFELRSSSLYSFITAQMAKLLQQKGIGKLLLMGMLNGILPCGMIFIALATSLLAENRWWSAASMLSFGIGTLPGMFAVGFLAKQINSSFRIQLNRLYPYIMTVIGLMLILRGANLGIPYLSPKIEQVSQNVGAGEKQINDVVINCHQPTASKQSK